MSISITPTWMSSSAARANARAAVNVDLPTPPFPLRTRILCLIPERRAWRSGRSGSGPLGRLAHIDWFGQPLQLSAMPLLYQKRLKNWDDTLGRSPFPHSVRWHWKAYPTGHRMVLPMGDSSQQSSLKLGLDVGKFRRAGLFRL